MRQSRCRLQHLGSRRPRAIVFEMVCCWMPALPFETRSEVVVIAWSELLSAHNWRSHRWPPGTRPTILFIVVDDCGYADLGCTGQTDYATPMLDRLVSEGVRFTQANANAPLCTNTRVALITGRYQYRLPIGLVEPLRWSDRDAPEMGVPPGFPTLPSLLRGAGYRTALIGKWHLGYLPRYSPLKSGYDEFFGVMGGFTGYYTHVGDGGEHDLYEGEIPIKRAGYVTDLLSERAVAWIAAASSRPEPY